MHGPIGRYLTEDHRRLDALMQQTLEGSGAIDRMAFERFRKGLLRHIGLEERIIAPAARRKYGGPIPGLSDLRRDHSRIVAMLEPTPTRATCESLRLVLEQHNRVEEASGAVYDLCEELLEDEAEVLVARLRATRANEVRVFDTDGHLPLAL